MKLEISTTDKTITILDDTSILELLNFLKEKELDDYKIKSTQHVSDRLVERRIEYVPVPYQPYSPWQQPFVVTC